MNVSVQSFAKLFPSAVSKREKGPETPVLLNECPEVVGTMALEIQGGRSVEHAVREIQRNGPPVSGEMFGRIVTQADTRSEPDIRQALYRTLQNLPAECAPYAQAVRMVLSASEARSEDERDRLLAEARRVSLNGLKDAGKAFGSSLNLPFLLIFGAGIMIPMVLMSVLPMISVSGAFGTSAMNPVTVAAITLVAIPQALMFTVAAIRERNPFRRPLDRNIDMRGVLALASAAPIILVLAHMGLDAPKALAVGMQVSQAAAFAVLMDSVRKKKDDRTQASALRSAVFDMGNLLVSGTPFEEQFRTAVSAYPGGPELAKRMDVEFALCHGSGRDAISAVVGGVSEDLEKIYAAVYGASLEDIRSAGRLALQLAKQMEEQDSVRTGIRMELKSMTDTMAATAMLFAPLVLGLGIAIMGPMSSMAGSEIGGGSALTTAVYLVELCAVIAVMLQSVRGEDRADGIVRTFAGMVPPQMIVYVLALSINFRRGMGMTVVCVRNAYGFRCRGYPAADVNVDAPGPSVRGRGCTEHHISAPAVSTVPGQQRCIMLFRPDRGGPGEPSHLIGKGDFGTGFYAYADRRGAETTADGDVRGIREYVFAVADAEREGLDICVFGDADGSWRDFVADCRDGVLHGHDIVVGPVRRPSGEGPLTDGGRPVMQYAFCSGRQMKHLSGIGHVRRSPASRTVGR